MASKRSNGEGTYGKKKVNGIDYFFYRDTQGHYTYSRTQKQLKEKIAEKKNNQYVLNSKTTFGQYISEWIKTKEGTITQRTYDDYESLIINLIIKYKDYDLSNKQLHNLSSKVFQSYLNSLAKKYAKSTIEKIWTIIKQCVKYGEIKNEIPYNTIAFVKIPKEIAVPKKDIPFLTYTESEKLYNIMELKYKNGEYVYKNKNGSQAVIFIMYSGLRIGELMALKWKNVNMNKYTINVVESRCRIKNKDKDSNLNYVYVDKSTKTESGNRAVPIPTRGMDVLRYFDKKYPNHKPDDYVFVNNEGNPIDYSNVNRIFKAMLKSANLPKASIHSLRHTYGSILIEKGIDIKKVSELMGHADITTTYNIYIGITDDDKKEAVLSVFG